MDDMNEPALRDRIALLERGVAHQMAENAALERELAFKTSCIVSLRTAVGELQRDRETQAQAIAEATMHAGER